MNTQGRPLSPHLGIYRWPVSMVLSILHRISGLALSAGLLVFVGWLAAIAFDPERYDSLQQFLQGAVGQLLLFGWCLAFFFHLASGVRHLIWDTGRLFEKKQIHASAWFVIVATLLMTFGYWFLV